MSPFAKAMEEKYGIMVYEDSQGFFSFSTRENLLYVEEFYVEPEFRSAKKGRELVETMIKLAKEFFCTEIIISIYMRAKNNLQDITLILALRNGFRLSHSSETHIFLRRGL